MNFILSIILAAMVSGSVIDPADLQNWEVQCVENDVIGKTPVIKLCLKNPNPNCEVQHAVAVLVSTPNGPSLMAYGYMLNDVVFWYVWEDGHFVQKTPTPC